MRVAGSVVMILLLFWIVSRCKEKFNLSVPVLVHLICILYLYFSLTFHGSSGAIPDIDIDIVNCYIYICIC